MNKTFSAILSGLFVWLALAPLSLASENTSGKLSGDQIELFEKAHTFAGSILDTPVFGVFQEDPFGAVVQIRKGSKTLNLNLVAKEKHYSGTVIETNRDGTEIKTTVSFNKIQKLGETAAILKLEIDGQPLDVHVEANTFLHGHFQGPKFEAVLGERKITFTFTGQSCFGYSINLAMMVLGSYAHLLK